MSGLHHRRCKSVLFSILFLSLLLPYAGCVEAESFQLKEGWSSFQVPSETEWSRCGIVGEGTSYSMWGAINAKLIGSKVFFVNEKGGLSSVAVPESDGANTTLLRPSLQYWIKTERSGLELVIRDVAVASSFSSSGVPGAPVVTCDAESTSPSVLKASWLKGDGEVSQYEYAIGTCEGCADVAAWSSTGLQTSVERGGLNLDLGRQYFISVRAINSSGTPGEEGHCSSTIVEAYDPYVKRIIDDNGPIEEIVVPPSQFPPSGEVRPEADLELSLLQSVTEVQAAAGGVNILSDVPASDWAYGCSATSAAMMMGYYDRISHPNMYTGSTDSGVYPLTNATWGSGENPLSATHQGIDGLADRGSVDDFWISYSDCSTDPYITNSWTRHTFGDAVGDYMGTNQSIWSNCDGSTRFYTYSDGTRLDDYSASEPTYRDGNHGLRLFIEARGYTVSENYNQVIYGYNGNTQGFTFADFQAQIDAGRPVLIHVIGHTMLGYGYDDSSSTIYIHDTWDHSSHTMTWAGSYSGMQHKSVSVVVLNSADGTPTPTATATATATPTNTFTPTSTVVPTSTFTPTPTPTHTYTPSATATGTPTTVSTPTATSIPTDTPVPPVTATSIPSATATPTATQTPEESATSIPEDEDNTAPVVKAMKSYASPYRKGTLKYKVTEESGWSSDRIEITKRNKLVRTLRVSMSEIPSDNIRRVSTRALARGSYEFCARVTDSSGNRSNRSCAALYSR